jgi:two-component system, OmpR family, response regulator
VARRRELGPVTLDLLHRDARAGRGWLSLHPREFELLWRLAEQPGERVSRARLLREVWRLDFEPGTNTVEVHVSRLRAKLAGAGIAGLVETDPQGGYRLSQRTEERLCA